MLKGDYFENLKFVIDKPLGPVLKELEKLDNSDGKPYLNQNDYKLLYKIKEIRNYWAHKGYIEVLYGSKEDYPKRLNDSLNRIVEDITRLDVLAEQLENIRIDMMKHYGRS